MGCLFDFTRGTLVNLLPTLLGQDYLTVLSMGSKNDGNNFPGVARPFDMVKLGPDLLDSKTNTHFGYLLKGNFSGFSMIYEQGTGGASKYGTVSQLPLVSNTIKILFPIGPLVGLVRMKHR